MSRHQRVVVALAVFLTAAGLAGAGVGLVRYVDRRTAVDAGTNAATAILVDCTTPTPPPTPEDPEPAPHECYERGQRGQSGAIVEVDCRNRRMQARLPAPPDPRRPCTEQTPAYVFPGITGEPPR